MPVRAVADQHTLRGIGDAVEVKIREQIREPSGGGVPIVPFVPRLSGTLQAAIHAISRFVPHHATSMPARRGSVAFREAKFPGGTGEHAKAHRIRELCAG